MICRFICLGIGRIWMRSFLHSIRIWLRFLDGRLRLGCYLTLASRRQFWFQILLWAWCCLVCSCLRKRFHGVMLLLIWRWSSMVVFVLIVKLRRCVNATLHRLHLLKFLTPKRVRLQLCRPCFFHISSIVMLFFCICPP
jgi:hypothetical protein